MSVLAKLEKLGLELPEVAKPVAAYVPAVTVGNQVWTSGQLPVVNGKLLATGKVGAEVDVATAASFARVCCLNGLAAINSQVNLDRVKRIFKVVVFVSSAVDFDQQAVVANGASELLGELFPDGHARSAVGVSVLPLNSPVELELYAEFE